jgi:hypothetical protein
LPVGYQGALPVVSKQTLRCRPGSYIGNTVTRWNKCAEGTEFQSCFSGSRASSPIDHNRSGGTQHEPENVALKSIEAQRRRTLETSIHRIAAKAFEDGFNLTTVTAATLNPQGTLAHAAQTFFSALAVSRFLDAVWLERGLSPNTLTAYRAHLTTLARWLAERGVMLIRTSHADLQDFIASRVPAGVRSGSAASQLTSFRQFFRYLVREAVIDEDPTSLIAMPKRE